MLHLLIAKTHSLDTHLFFLKHLFSEFMAKTTTPILSFLVFLILINSGGTAKLANAQKWCVAKPSASEAELSSNINYACRFVNCDVVKLNGACFYPNTLESHASVAMNLYYKTQGARQWNCDFTKSALLTVTNPSFGNCKYA